MCIVMLNIKMGRVWILGDWGSKVGKKSTPQKGHAIKKHWDQKGEDVNHCTWVARQYSKRLVHLGQATC